MILPSLETGAPRANGSPTESTSGDFLISARARSICGRWLGVQHAAVVDREDDRGGVARLLREALLQQVVGALGLGARQAEVVDVLARGRAPECGGRGRRRRPRGRSRCGADRGTRRRACASDENTDVV